MKYIFFPSIVSNSICPMSGGDGGVDNCTCRGGSSYCEDNCKFLCNLCGGYCASLTCSGCQVPVIGGGGQSSIPVKF